MGRLNRGALVRPLILMAMALVAAAGWPPVSAQALDVKELPAGGAVFQQPVDATPNPDGSMVYFLATTESGEPGVFRVPAAGGPVTLIYSGAPLTAPHAIVFSSDGSVVYIADPVAGGVVFALPSLGGTPSPLVASVRTGARVLDLVSVNGIDQLYIGGLDPQSGEAAVFRMNPAGSDLETLYTGGPLTVVDGLAATSAGEVYIAAPASERDANGRVLRLRGGAVETVIEAVHLGSPAGIALTLDESRVIVSSLAADGTSQVAILDVVSGAVSTANDVIGVNQDSGGLHRALQRDWFAWVSRGRTGGSAGNAGTIYGISTGVISPADGQ